MSPNWSGSRRRPSVLTVYWKSMPAGRGGRADAPRRDLHVLLLQGLEGVRGGHVARGQRRRIEPDAHAVVACAEEADVTHPGQPGERVLHLDGGVVAEVELVVSTVGR